MRIQKLKVKNCQYFYETELNCNLVNILLGFPTTGKTIFLKELIEIHSNESFLKFESSSSLQDIVYFSPLEQTIIESNPVCSKDIALLSERLYEVDYEYKEEINYFISEFKQNLIEGSFSISKLGTSLYYLLEFLATIYYKNKIFLINTPEILVYPSNQKYWCERLGRFLSKTNNQYFIETNSEAIVIWLLENVGADKVNIFWFTRKEGEKTRIFEIKDKEKLVMDYLCEYTIWFHHYVEENLNELI